MKSRRILSLMLCIMMLLGMVQISEEPGAHVHMSVAHADEAACTHENTEIWEEWDKSDATYEYLDVGTHSVYGIKVYEVTYCSDCGAEVSRTLVDNDKTATFIHDYDSDNTCKDCKYVCKHSVGYEDEKCIACGKECREHDFYGSNYYSEGVCVNCGYVCPHDGEFEGSMCLVCGGYCQHPSHEATKDAVCTVCGEYAGHQYSNGTVNNGVCWTCGYACPHESGWAGTRCYGCGYTCTHLNHQNDREATCTLCGRSSSHSFDGQDACTVCGYTCPGHNYYDEYGLSTGGKCAICGAPCPHDEGFDENGYCNKCSSGCNDHKYGEDSKCVLCGAECYHWDGYEYTYEEGVCVECGYVCRHERGHNSETTACNDCGLIVGHEWEDGYCYPCGTQCDHEEWAEGVCTRCAKVCEHNHHDWETAVCNECGMNVGHKWENGYCGGCYYSCNHADLWKDGVCTMCGTVCEHPYHDAWTGNCGDCGEHVGHKWEGNYCYGCYRACYHSDQYGAKLWKGGVCVECGAVCEHSNHDAWTAECSKCGEYVGHTWMDTWCPGCGRTCYHEDSSGVSLWKDGVCTECRKVCEHSYHESNGLCYYCGEPVEHSWREDGVCTVCWHWCEHKDAEGNSAWENDVCGICGKVCNHDYTTMTQVEVGIAEYANNHWRDGWHRELPVIEKTWTCNDCGKVTKQETSDGNWREAEHVLTDGVCLCGYMIPEICPHTDMEVSVSLEDVEVFVDITLYTHTWVRDEYEYSSCPTCKGEWKKLLREDVHTIEPHDMLDGMEWQGGVCGWCGYCGQCPHEETHIEYEVASWYEEASYTDLTAATHNVTGELIKKTVCDDCGVTLREDCIITSQTLPHEWNWERTACEQCGYENVCAHENKVETEGYAGISHYGDINAQTHTTYGYYGVHTVCPDCGMDYWDSSWEDVRPFVEEHTMKNGMCTACSYTETPCAHTSYTVLGVRFKYDRENTEYHIEEDYHSYFAEVWEERYCKDCLGETKVMIGEEAVPVHEKHQFEDGRCWTCGYEIECDHSDVRYHIYYEGGEWSPKDEETHYVSGGEKISWAYCNVCNTTVQMEQREPNEVAVEKHEYEQNDPSGACWKCGYVNEALKNCTHSETYLDVWMDETTMRIYNLTWNTHTYSAYTEQTIRCKACDWIMQFATNGDLVVTEEHILDADNKCTVCGYDAWILNVVEFEKTGTVNGEGVGLWGIPSSGGCTEAAVANGEELKLIAEITTNEDMIWYAVQYNEQVYFVETKYVTLKEEPVAPALNGWVSEDGKWYYYEDGHKVVASWRKDSVGWVYLGADGAMLTDAWVQDSIGWCYVGGDGYAVTNCWKQDSVGWCYLNGEGSMVKNAWVETDGLWYWLNEEGYMVTNSWRQDSVGWVYLGSDGAMLTNAWVMDSIGWCYVGDDGYAVTNCWKQDSVGWCYLNGEGSMVKNDWVMTDGEWYYLNGDGYRVENAWTEVGGKWYWLNGDGTMATNMWQQDSIGWVYVGADGAMVTDAWTQDSVGWCYMGSDGYAVTNMWKHDGTGWRYLDGNGSMLKNVWLQDGGSWYWFNAEGYMVTGNVTVDGVEYVFGDDGALIG